MEPIFKDLRVVELASVLAGPAVGMFFAELGATVVKVENKTTSGDVTRNWKLPSESPNSRESAYYKSVNWGKQCLFLDLGLEEDMLQLLPYLLDADIVICNFRSGSAEKLGLDYRTLSKMNKGIIYANLTAFGPNNRQPGFDVLLQAETGFLSMTGHPGEAPAKMPVALIDILAAHQLKEAILIGLLKRNKTGEGCHIQASLAQTAIASLANQASNYLNEGFVAEKMGSQHPNISPYGDIFHSSEDVPIILAVGTDKHFEDLCACLDLKALSTDPRFATNASRVRNRETLNGILREAIGTIPGKELLDRFRSHSVPAGQIRDIESVFEQDYAREMILDHPTGGSCVKTISFELTPYGS